MAARRKLADNELLIVRTFNAPPSVVFALWSSAEHLKQWMGPKDFACPQAIVDFRVGGSYRVLIKSASHGENWFGGVYREIVPDKRLAFTFTWDNDGPSAGLEMLVTITFEEQDGKTQMTDSSVFQSVADRDGMLRSGMESGAAESMDRLDEYLAASR